MKGRYIQNLYFRLFAPLFTGVVVYMLVLMIFGNLSVLFIQFVGKELWLCIGLSYAHVESFRAVTVWWSRHKPHRRLAVQRILWLLVTSFNCWVVVVAGLSLYFTYSEGLSFGTFNTELSVFGALFTTLNSFYALLYWGYEYIFKENELLLDEEKYRQEELRYKALNFKNTVNPLFLYESLEALIIQAQQEGDAAMELLEHLSAVYRYKLHHQSDELVPIELELEASRHLATIMKVRYNQHISVCFDVAGQLSDIHVVPGAIQTAINYIAGTSIIHAQRPVNIMVGFDEQATIVISAPLNQLLIIDEAYTNMVARLAVAYKYFSDVPVTTKQNDNKIMISMPQIVLEHD